MLGIVLLILTSLTKKQQSMVCPTLHTWGEFWIKKRIYNFMYKIELFYEHVSRVYECPVFANILCF